MAAELRWILLALSVPLLAVIWWWTARRSRQAPGNAALRESTIGPVSPAHAAGSGDGAAAMNRASDAESRDFGVSPFEPLSIRTHDFERLQIIDPPMTAHAEPLDAEADAVMSLGSAEPETALDTHESVAWHAPEPASPPEAAAETPPVMPAVVAAPTAPTPVPRPSMESSGRFAAVTPQAPNVSETQRIVTVRVSAEVESRWAGSELLAALEMHGLAYGRYKVFHRKHSDGRTLFCAASLVEPGTFDIATMPADEFRGLTLFAVLPGPADALQTIDALIATAAELAETLHGTVQDSKGAPLSAQRAEALREDVARFQASLTMT